MEIASVELEIQRILDSDPSLDAAAKHFTALIASDETSDEHRFGYWSFLVQAGFFNAAMESMAARLSAKSRIHWGLFIEIFNRSQIDPSSSIIESAFKGIKRQNAMEDIWASFGWDSWDERFQQIREGLAQEKLRLARERKEALIEKFHFLKSQRMHEQAARVLKHLIFLYPEESRFAGFKDAFDEEWAREVLANRFTENPAEPEVAPLTKEQNDLLQAWISAAESHIDDQPQAAYDLAMSFHFLEAHEATLKTLERAATGVATDWLRAETLFKLRRYVDVLELMQTLEAKYVDDPETAFAVAYLRAQSMKALGQSAQAVEILRNIIQVRPNYRSAQRLLLEWSIGVSNSFPAGKGYG